MRVAPFVLSSLAAAAVAALPAPAAAQRAATPAAPRPAVANAIGRTLATYRFAAAARQVELPAIVTVADSAGTLVATFRQAGDAEPRPMLVTVFGADLVLQGQGSAGVITLLLLGQNDQGPVAITGEWWLAGQHGHLRGRVVR